MSDLFGPPVEVSPTLPRSTVGTLGRLGPSDPSRVGQYPRPWYYSWDAPVWRVLAQDRTVVATCSDEEAAAMICRLAP